MDTNNMNQNQNQQPVYTQPVGQPEVEAPVSVGDWVLTILLMCIPCVNIIMLFVWAFGSSAPKSKSNWAKAQLIWVLIGVVITIIFYVVFGAALLAQYGGY